MARGHASALMQSFWPCCPLAAGLAPPALSDPLQGLLRSLLLALLGWAALQHVAPAQRAAVPSAGAGLPQHLCSSAAACARRLPARAGHHRQPRQPARVRGAVARKVEPTEEQVAADVLAASAVTQSVPPEEVFEAIRTLEVAKDAAKDSGFASLLTGNWRLIYTTGTKKTEDEIGRVNYVPITAVQRFDMQKRFIRNGVYLGPISLEFEGELRWIEDRRRLEFDFDDLKVCGVSLPLPDFIRGAAGMRSETPYKKQPAFNFIIVDETIAAARGAGGGVALWLRNELAK